MLDFTPELPITKVIVRSQPADYVTADIEQGRTDLVLDLERLDLPYDSYDRIVCSHALEHVDDKRGFIELLRVLRPGGQLIVMIPIIEGWDETYEDPMISSPEIREINFQQWDHVRIYGRDFRQRAIQAGFCIEEFTAALLGRITFQLMRDEKVFKLQARPEVGIS